MTIDAGLKPEGAPERAPIAGAGAPSGVDAGPKRYSVQRKLAVVACLLRGEPLDVVAREANLSVAKLTEWRDRALAGAASALKERERDDREDEIARLQSKVGEITMDNELLSARARRSHLPRLVVMAWRGSRARGAFRAPAFIAFSRERHRLRSPVVAPVRQALVRMLTWPIISAGKSKRPTFTAKAIANYGRDCALPGFARALAACAG